MAKPIVQPSVLCVKLAPGESAMEQVSLSRPPSAATVTASISNGSGLITLAELIVFGPIHRAATAEEINELPPGPLREKLRKDGITDVEELGRSDGTLPLHVPPKGTLQISIACSAASSSAPP